MSRETHISTKQSCSQTPPRLPVADGNEKRPESSGSPSCQRPEETVRIGQASPLALNDETATRVERLSVRREFLFVAGGHADRRRSVVVQARTRKNATTELHAGAGFTATKKVGGAVIRNRAKRRLREAARLLMPKYALAGVDYVFIARRDTHIRPWQGLLDDVETALISLRGKLLSGQPPERDKRRPGNKRGGSRPRREK